MIRAKGRWIHGAFDEASARERGREGADATGRRVERSGVETGMNVDDSDGNVANVAFDA